MSFLFRSQIILAIIAALMLTGYASSLAECCHFKKAAHSDSAESGCASETDCQCVCHVADALQPLALASLPAQKIAVQNFAVPNGQFPPDAVPLGIDYPPQLS